MKIFLPFETEVLAGPATFVSKFKSGMEKRGHEISFSPRDDYDILFLIVQGPFQYLLDAKKRGKKIVQRLDGAYYWSVSGWRYPILNAKARIIRHFFADFTVYQSEYSKRCSAKFLGKKKNEQSIILYNGVDTEVFSPSGEKALQRNAPKRTTFFTVSAFRREDQIIPLIESLKIYREKYGNNFQCFIAGTFLPRLRNIPARYKNFKNIHFLGRIENEEVPNYERSADVFLCTHLNPPCPNNIIEALACGLPVCGVADGSMPELITPEKNGLLVETSGDAFWKVRQLNLEAFADNLHTLVLNQARYSKESRRIAEERFSLDTMIKGYETVFQNLLSH